MKPPLRTVAHSCLFFSQKSYCVNNFLYTSLDMYLYAGCPQLPKAKGISGSGANQNKVQSPVLILLSVHLGKFPHSL